MAVDRVLGEVLLQLADALKDTLTPQLHLLTAKLMSSVGISLLWEILCDMRHHLPFC